MQVFALEKVYVKVYPMKSPSGFMAALKEFVKEIGAPEILVANMHPSQKIKEVNKFCNIIGSTLRLLEQGTQWDNMAEMYVGLLKEVVCKDM